MKNLSKKIALYAGIVVGLLVLAYGFTPQVLTGKIVDQSDISGYVGMAKETNTWNEQHPYDRTAWTNSMFGGMPTTMLTGNNRGDLTKPLYDLSLAGKRPASYLFISLLGAFLLLLSLGISPLLSAAGAVAVTFCAYNLQIIQVGHNAKMLSLAYAPWVLAGVVFTYRTALGSYRKKDENKSRWGFLPLTFLGACLFSMALNFQIKANHVQITYYLAIIILSYFLVLAVWILGWKERRKLFIPFVAASLMLLFIGGIGIATNTNRLLPTYKYTQETMRGGSDLKADDDGNKSKGLDLEYATSWSYGWEELPNMMIPNFNGGSSAGSINPEKSATAQLFKRAGQTNYRQVAKSLPLYWGPQPFTAGPMYMGAITIFLFILGLMLYKGKERWWLLIPTLIGIFLALGNHFMAFTKFWYYHVPFYSKFRTVSMALVILQITLPMLGFLVLDKILGGEYDKDEFKKKGLIALAITGGFCLLCAVFPSIAGTFTGGADAQMQKEIVETLVIDRIRLLRNDALLSLVFIAGTFALLWWFYSSSKKGTPSRRRSVEIAVLALVLVNMLPIGKRYLNSDHFVSQRQFDNQFTQRTVDKEILKDSELDYRVLDLTVNVFNDSHPSYYHKNIGGYSPVKLQRYQDLIDTYLSAEISSIYPALRNVTTFEEAEKALPALPILSMLNDKYIIIDDDSAPLRNLNAMGSAWLVERAVSASTPAEEIALIGSVDLRKEIVIGEDFAAYRSSVKGGSEEDKIELIDYAPNTLIYHYSLSSPRTAVLSEIYYPNGWYAWTVVGDEKKDDVDIYRANWTLRAVNLPQGEGDLVLRFDPPSYSLSTKISRASSSLLLLLTLLAIGGTILSEKKNPENKHKKA